MTLDETPLILHVFSTFDPGGPELRAVEIMQSLGEDFRHGILAIDGKHSASKRLSPMVSFRLINGYARSAPKRGLPTFSQFKFISVLATEVRVIGRVIRQEKPVLVLTYNIGAIATIIFLRITKLAPLIHFEDGFGSDEFEKRKATRNLLRRLLLPAAYQVVVPSVTLQELLINECRLPRSLVTCIRNGVDTVLFCPNETIIARKQLGLPKDVVIFGTVCRLRPEKRIDLLLRAFRRANLADALLLIAGDGPCRRELMLLAESLGVAQSVKWVGEILPTSIHYNALDVFVSSSDTEQLPFAMLEAMSCGVPIISTDVGDCRDALTGGPRELIVSRGDVEGLAFAMRWSYTNRDSCRATGEAHRSRCLSNYDHRSMIESHCILYKKAINAGSMGRRQPN